MLEIIISLSGGLGLFLFGMNTMSSGIENVAGARLRSIIERLAQNKFMGLITGLIFTALIQSSSASTVMAVSFVNSGLMTLSQASGIILGANIGTTVTALIVAIKLSAVAPIFVFVGAVAYTFVKKNPMVQKIGQVILGFGILFVGISIMSDAMGSLKSVPGVLNALSAMSNPIMALLLGLVITSVVQSSSVTVSILVVMGAEGLIDLHTSMFVVLGCNMGACTSALLAALQSNKDGKRTALIHLLVNIIGAAIFFFLLLVAGDTVERIVTFFGAIGTTEGVMGRNIAWAHILTRVVQVVVCYPLMNAIIKLTYIIVPGEDKEPEENAFRLKFINTPTLPNPAVAIYLAVQEMERMAHKAFGNLNLALECLVTGDTLDLSMVFETEKYVDFLDAKISDYLVKINQTPLPIRDANRISAYFHVVNDIERIGDHANDIGHMTEELAAENISFTHEAGEELREMMKKVNRILEKSLIMFVTGDTHDMQEIKSLEDEIDEIERELQTKHITRLNEGYDSAQVGIYFSDVASALERVGDHAINIAFALVESKKIT